MDSTSPRAHPFETAEAIIGALLPPACREELLGDLHERHTSAGQYVTGALAALPLVIASHIRRNTDIRIFLLTAYATVYSFTAAGFRSERLSLYDDPWALLRIAIPSIAALFALLLRNAWAGREGRTQLASTVDIGIAMTFAYLSQVTLSIVKPELALPRWCPSQGAFVGWLFLSMVRAMFPPQAACSREPHRPVTQEDMRWKAEEFATDINLQNRRACMIAAVLLAAFTAVFVLASVTRVRIGAALMVAGILYMLWQLRTTGSPAAVEYGDRYRAELRRRHDFLCRARFWYLCSVIPGCGLLMMNAGIYPCYVFMYIFLIGELIHRAALSIQRDLEELGR